MGVEGRDDFASSIYKGVKFKTHRPRQLAKGIPESTGILHTGILLNSSHVTDNVSVRSLV